MTNYEGESERNNRFVYWVAWASAGGLHRHRARHVRLRPATTRQASDKADEFIAALDEAGLTAPSKDQITRVLGDDGGALCDDPGERPPPGNHQHASSPTARPGRACGRSSPTPPVSCRAS